MKTIKLFMDFEFTSLSPDAQPISLGIVSEEIKSVPATPINVAKKIMGDNLFNSKSFYAEFSDFDINRCDDWVKKNVLSKLRMWRNQGDFVGEILEHSNYQVLSIMQGVRTHLANWLTQFSDYQIQFVCDCGTWDWYWMVQLLAEWETKEIGQMDLGMPSLPTMRTGLPKLPTNISPVPEDLNDLIARVKGITVRTAFDLNREELAYGPTQVFVNPNVKFGGEEVQKHNALWDAKVIKEIYQKLK
jgi:hypothetical protein